MDPQSKCESIVANFSGCNRYYHYFYTKSTVVELCVHRGIRSYVHILAIPWKQWDKLPEDSNIIVEYDNTSHYGPVLELWADFKKSANNAADKSYNQFIGRIRKKQDSRSVVELALIEHGVDAYNYKGDLIAHSPVGNIHVTFDDKHDVYVAIRSSQHNGHGRTKWHMRELVATEIMDPNFDVNVLISSLLKFIDYFTSGVENLRASIKVKAV
jgi:hypothetical protein